MRVSTEGTQNHYRLLQRPNPARLPPTPPVLPVYRPVSTPYEVILLIKRLVLCSTVHSGSPQRDKGLRDELQVTYAPVCRYR